MIRKCHLVSLILPLISTSVSAAGFYLGAGAGPDLGRFNVNSRVTQINPTNGILSFDVKNKEEAAGTGGFGTIFAGYGMRFSADPRLIKNLYMAGELNINGSTLKHENSNREMVNMNASKTTYQLQHSFGIGLLPGFYMQENTLLYARAGYANGNFKVTTSDVSLANIHKILDGFRWGIGLQQTLLPQLGIRVEYSQIVYQSTHITTLDALRSVTKKTTFTPETNQVEFSLLYQFLA